MDNDPIIWLAIFGVLGVIYTIARFRWIGLLEERRKIGPLSGFERSSNWLFPEWRPGPDESPDERSRRLTALTLFVVAGLVLLIGPFVIIATS